MLETLYNPSLELWLWGLERNQLAPLHQFAPPSPLLPGHTRVLPREQQGMPGEGTAGRGWAEGALAREEEGRGWAEARTVPPAGAGRGDRTNVLLSQRGSQNTCRAPGLLRHILSPKLEVWPGQGRGLMVNQP